MKPNNTTTNLHSGCVDQLGLLVFALTTQPTLSAGRESAADAVVTECHDDMYIHGSEDAVAAGPGAAHNYLHLHLHLHTGHTLGLHAS